jgi:hypothetical protein
LAKVPVPFLPAIAKEAVAHRIIMVANVDVVNAVARMAVRPRVSAPTNNASPSLAARNNRRNRTT